MHYDFPQTTKHLKQRSELIASSLRPDGLPFDIDLEYPIVLNKQNKSLSHCIFESDRMIGHATVWPRHLLLNGKKSDEKIALIGNVATDSEFRGRGVMRQLFNKIYTFADSNNLKALILWSDLHQFYQNLGFRSLGKERRYFIEKSQLDTFKGINAICELADSQNVENHFLAQLFAIRPSIGLTIHRSPSEFNKLLTIPKTYLYISFEKNIPTSYIIIGKGYDMEGVIHEWGTTHFPHFGYLLRTAIEHQTFERIILLSPFKTQWDTHLREISDRCEFHHMALVREKEGQKNPLDEMFIWGLDSI